MHRAGAPEAIRGPGGDAPQAIEQVFRREAGKVLATVARVVGSLDEAEELVQDAMIAALERWPSAGVPDNPAAWLMVTAKNRALDQTRHRRTLREKQPLLQADALAGGAAPSPEEAAGVIPDDQLRLIFTCCHPVLPVESQVALTLRLMGGLSTGEIARAFLSSEPTVAQRIVRAKRTIEEAKVPYEVPERSELGARLPAVLGVVYLIFNEGYTARAGDALLRADLCDEALRLAGVLAELMPDEAEVLGLAALMELTAARNAARTADDGSLVPLPAQDRSRWDRARIARGAALLRRARALARPGPYQIEAAIAACHAQAPAYEATDWRRIAALYGELCALDPSPVIELNRAVAVSRAEGPAEGLSILERLAAEPALGRYHLLYSTRGELLLELDRGAEAAESFRRAMELTENEREREHLAARIERCGATPGGRKPA